MKFLYRGRPPPLAFKWRFDHFSQAARDFGRSSEKRQSHAACQGNFMISAAHGAAPRRREVDAAADGEVIGAACRRYPSIGQTEKTARLEQLIRTGAWTDAALALIDLELPLWQVRRLAYDDGEWHCALSRERELPDWLDQSIETRHADLALAILSAFVEARRTSTGKPDQRSRGGPACGDFSRRCRSTIRLWCRRSEAAKTWPREIGQGFSRRWY